MHGSFHGSLEKYQTEARYIEFLFQTMNNKLLCIFCSRQLCETVDWIFSESMIIYYIQQFTLSLWPDGKLAENESSRSDEEKLKTRMEAKEKFLQNMPGMNNQKLW